jgi:hypothetical protein
MNQEIIRATVDKLANAMRIYGETRMLSRKLINIDTEEAVNNIDRAFDAKLETFHSVYEIIQDNKLLNCFNYADTSAIILLRNVRHHITDSLFKSWNVEMLTDGGLRKKAGASFLMAGYTPIHEEAIVAENYYKLSDFIERLKHEKVINGQGQKVLFENDLSFSKILSYAESQKLPTAQVYINVIPIFMSAIARLLNILKERGGNFTGYDSAVFIEHFTKEPLIDLGEPSYKIIRT